MTGQDFVEVLIDGHRMLPALLRDIAEARRTIHVSIFLFFRDPIGDQVGDALIAAAQRGVTVRLLMNMAKTRLGDPFSTGAKEMMDHDPNVHHDVTDVAPLCRRLRAGGVAVLDTDIDYHRVIPTRDPRIASLAAQLRETVSLDDLHVDHRKLIVLDGRVGYCGGANIGAQYLYHQPFDPRRESHAEADAWRKEGNPEPWWKWHDSLTRFEGPVAAVMDGHFRDRWILDGGPEFPPPSSPADAPGPPRGRPVRRTQVLVNEPNDQPNEVRETYVRLIGEARSSIFIENPYTYHPAIVEALLAAKKRRPELRVDLILPARRWNDNKFAHDAQQYHYARYLAHDIAVHEYQGHFNHLKVAVFDERISIHGSTNLNHRSLEDDKDFELVVLVEDEPLARALLAEVRDVDQQCSKRFTRADVEGTLGRRLTVKWRNPLTRLLLARRVL